MAWLLHWSWLTFFLALTGVCFLALLDWTGLPPEAALARFRTILVGRVRPAAEVITLRRRAHW
jgi:intracellular multiplication protein IcmT